MASKIVQRLALVVAVACADHVCVAAIDVPPRLDSTVRDPAVGRGSHGLERQPFHREFPTDPPAPPQVLQKRATEPAGVWVRGRFTSIQVNVDQFGNNIVGDAANEPSIAIDPTDRDNVVIGWRQFDSISSNFRTSGYAYSHDGGTTWTFPGVLEPGVFSSDPVLSFDADGNIYYYALQSSRGPGSWSCYLYRTGDGGVTWPREVYAYGGDKAWMIVDSTTGMGSGNVYVAWSPWANCCSSRLFTRSVDGGLTFLNPVTIPGNPYWGTLTVDRDGALYITGESGYPNTFGHSFYVVRSTNAKNPAATPTFALIAEVDLDGPLSFSVPIGPNPDGLLGQAWIGSDHSSSLTRGNLYLLSSVERDSIVDPLDVMFSRSTDGGVTWSAPVRVNDDPAGNWQWFGTMSVAPNGRIDVVWNDTRNSGQANLSELYYSFSLDGGVTWFPSTPVTPMFDSYAGWPQQNKLGDYYHMISENGAARLAYAATFNGEQDVYYVRITPDCNGNGVADETDIADLTSQDCNGNVTPDECEPNEDCNNNLTQDICDIASGTSEDCNYNGVPDECDVTQGTSPDVNGNGIPDECECSAPAAPVGAPGNVAETRYISSVPASAGVQTALRVTLADLPAPFEGSEGAALWVGPPRAISELAGVDDDTPPVFLGAGLQCDPYYRDWGSTGTVFVFGDQIMPGGRYAIQAIRNACSTALEANYSAALSVSTGSKWGDVVGTWNGLEWTAPDGDADFEDIAALVDKFKNRPGAPSKTQTDLAGDTPSLIVDFDDISLVVEGFRGLPYPYDGPGGCP